MTQLAITITDRIPALIAAADDQTACRYLEFFITQIRQENTQRFYAHRLSDFLA